MANAIYPKYKEAILQSAANSSLAAGVVKVALVDTATYTYSAAHEFQTSLTGVIGTPATLASKTMVNGAFDSADPTMTAVSGATGEALVIFIDTGSTATSRLVAFLDTGFTGLPVTPSGSDITIAVNASGWFTL